MPLSEGDKLGPHEILALVGKGGMGEVYRARDPRLKRDVAIKVSAGQFSERFEREAQAIAALNHPHICQIYDVGPNYLVMEFLEGHALLSQAEPGPLPLDRVLEYAGQICDALDAAHQKGTVHRDLKPANVLVTRSGIKLLDFGLAKVAQGAAPEAAVAGATQTMALTKDHAILGTVHYMSPEQAESKPADARSDIFSLGLVLYEMLGGRRAFDGESAVSIMAAILHKDPPPLDAPAEMQRVVPRCLAKQPADRFQTIADVKSAFKKAPVKTVEKQPSIAVLPFANMSRDADDEYFSDGLAEEIINALTQVQGLKVIARTSAFAFKGKNEDIRKIAEMLGVSNVLEGSVRRAGNRLRITAQLVQAGDGTHLWSQRYDRDLTDVFAVQDEIGHAISEALKLRLAPHVQTVNIEAYQLYLKGQYHRFRFTPESVGKAKECFEQALAIDPNYAPAHSGLAMYYLSLAGLSMKPVGEVAPLAKSAAEKALAIDPANSEAHSVLAGMAAIFDYDWKAAETHHRKAMATEPVPPMVRYRYVYYYLLPFGRIPDAMEQCRLALETDPPSMQSHFAMAYSI
jgi:serine/threonine protein kinase